MLLAKERAATEVAPRLSQGQNLSAPYHCLGGMAVGARVGEMGNYW